MSKRAVSSYTPFLFATFLTAMQLYITWGKDASPLVAFFPLVVLFLCADIDALRKKVAVLEQER